jgi:hypothetical protein
VDVALRAFGQRVAERRALVGRGHRGRRRVGEVEAVARPAEDGNRRVTGIGSGRARRGAELGDGTAAPQQRHVDVDRSGLHLRGEHGRNAAQCLVGIGELLDHGAHRGRGHEPAVRNNRAVPFLADERAVRARCVAAAIDRGSPLELRPGHAHMMVETAAPPRRIFGARPSGDSFGA